jgi:hypothetical protein
MNNLLEEIFQNINLILAGVPLEFEKIDERNQKTVLKAAVHCCLNGPVGVNKKTTFPDNGEFTIKSLTGASNNSWKKFCRNIALWIRDKNPQIPCNMLSRHKTYWPLNE